jgi:glycosyltransferase involved in cell wall biosynthesis
MKICLVSQEYPPETAHGGIGSQNFNKARALARLGHEVHVLSAANVRGADRRTETADGITVHRITPPGAVFPVNQPPTYWIGYSWEVFRHLGDLKRETAFDVIDFAEYGAEGFAYQLDRSSWNWVPIVVQLHGPLAMFVERIGWPERESDFARVGAFVEGESIRHADALMACSTNIADFVAQQYDIDRATIDVVHCGVDADTFLPTNRDRSPSAPIVLFVGNLAGNKGIHTVFNAVLNVRARYPNIRLQILGKGDPALVRRFQQQAAAAGAEQNIEFAGFVADRGALPQFYRDATVFCSPAQHEVGVANVYIEAMSCGCPVIAANTGGAPEAVLDGVCGLLVPPGDIDAMTRALDRVLGDSAFSRRLGEGGRRRVNEYFAMDKYIQRVLATYEKAIVRSHKKLRSIQELGL